MTKLVLESIYTICRQVKQLESLTLYPLAVGYNSNQCISAIILVIEGIPSNYTELFKSYNEIQTNFL